MKTEITHVAHSVWKEGKEYVLLATLGCTYIVLSYFDLIHIPMCLSKIIFHIPCPSCGSTRALMKILHGDVAGGIMFNPNVLILIAIILLLPVAIYLRYTRCPGIFRSINRFLARPAVFIPFAIFELCIWIRNIITGI